jgi:hypothetical protein
MAKSLFRRCLLALTVLAAVLALPLKASSQTASTSLSATASKLADAPGFVSEATISEATPASTSVFGRDAYFRANAAAMPPVIAVSPALGEIKPHRFWDRENAVLFSAVGGMAAADFYVTHANLASGGKELNPVTRVFAGSTPALATNFALETSGVIALGYLFHKTGHHNLERATSYISLGSSSTAVAYDLAHR